MFIDLREQGGREGARERSTEWRPPRMRTRDCHHPDGGANLQSRHVSWLGMEPTMLPLQDDTPTTEPHWPGLNPEPFGA